MRKKIIAAITVAVAGEIGPDGAPVPVYIPPGGEVVLDGDEADAIIARHGGEVLAVLPDDPAHP